MKKVRGQIKVIPINCKRHYSQMVFGRVGPFSMFRVRNSFLADVTMWITFFKKKKRKKRKEKQKEKNLHQSSAHLGREGDEETSPFKDADGNPSCIL